MLGRKTYTPEELDSATATVERQLAAFRRLADAVDATGDAEAAAARETFEPEFFNDLALVLDRYFVHRLRVSTGKDPNPINELELLSDSLRDHGGAFRTTSVIKYRPDQTGLQLEPGDRIQLDRRRFERFSTAFLDELRTRFVDGAA